MIIDRAERLKITKEYYFSVKLQEVRELMAGGKDIISIAIGNPDMAPSQSTIDELAKQANNPANHGYQPYRSIPELRAAIASWTKDTYGVSLNPEHEILPLIGSKEGITHISLAFINPGDEVLVPELGYPAYSAVTEMIGGKSVTYSMVENAQWKPDLQALEKTDLSKVKIMWINYPNMPTGAPASAEVFEEIIAFAREHKILVVHDNPYSLVLNEKPPVSLLGIKGSEEVAIELNSMSKSHNMAGWRIGWVAGEKSYIDAIVQIKSNVDSGMFKPMQLAAVEALKNSEAWHRERNEEYKKRRLLAWQILDRLSCSYDKSQTGMFIWAKVSPQVGSSEKLADYLLYEKNIFVTPGFIFGAKGEKYIRISLCVKQEQLLRVLERLESFDISKL
jgi:aspartate/methionine/tyrosine aminotransferase